MPGRRWGSLESPVDGLRALFDQQGVHPREGLGSEEAPGGRQWRGVGGGDRRRRAKKGSELLGLSSPQNRDERLVALGERADGVVGDLFPSLAAMGGGRAGTDGQHAVQKHDPVFAPRRQVAVGGGRYAEVVVELSIDVAQGSRDRADVAFDGEAQPDGVPRRGVGVLPDDEHANFAQRIGKCSQYVLAGGEVAVSGGVLGAQEVSH